jgi:NAD(P)-dependent dehydrogenase (short-subunit alcohol dehydrogenase family)
MEDFTPLNFQLNDKTAIVTGAGGGLGSAMALTLAQRGANVALADIDAEDCAEVVAAIEKTGRQAIAVSCDVLRKDDVEALVQAAVARFGQLNIIVNNAGLDRPCKALDLRAEDWDLVMNVNLRGSFFGCVAAARQMLSQGTGGRIINIGSAGAFLGTKNMVAYCASKAAVVNMTKTLAMEWGPRGVTVNAVCPGYTPTNVNAAALAHPQVKEAVIAKTALKRLGTPAEVAAVVAFLASDASSMITGAAICADMGTTCN